MATLRVPDLAKELGISDRDLLKRAADAGMVLSSFGRLQDDQVARLKQLLAPVRPALRPIDAKTAAVSGVPDARGGVVRRRAVVAPGEAGDNGTPAPGATPVPLPAAVASTPAPAPVPVAVARPAVVPAPVLRDDRPRLRRIKAEDLDGQTQPLGDRVDAPAGGIDEPVAPPEATPVAELPVAVEASAEGEAIRAAEPAPEPAAGPGHAPLVESDAASEAPILADRPAAVVATAAVPTSAAVAPAAVAVVEAIEARKDAAPMALAEIGKALVTPSALPSHSKVPRLTRMKMPEQLVNIPKATPRPPAPEPAPVVAPAPGVTAPDAPVGLRTGRDERPVDDSKGRGRKLIYDRRRDAMSTAGDVRVRGKKRGKVKVAPVMAAATKAEKRHLRIEDTVTVANLAHQLSVKATEVIRKLFDLGILATVNHPLDIDTVELIATDFGFTVENVGFDLDQYLQKPEDVKGEETPRSPVVTVMGHVDHGKTSLLDAIRKTHTAAKEAGGITQHIGAYVAELANRGRVVFLDTPGHEAFTAMRARGAKATDVIVLVVAADDGVMPQTIEAVNHAKAAQVPVIVAVNKVDKPGADTEKVRRELAEHGIVSEEWGGEVTFCEVSAKTGKGIDHLLEMLALQSDVLELKANAKCDAKGLVIESRLEKGRGPVATLLVQHGTLKKGQYIVSGTQFCRVRLMLDHTGRTLEDAGPATPAEIIGFESVTTAGDEFYVVADEKKAKAIVEHRIEKLREKEALKTSRRSIEDMLHSATQVGSEQKELCLIIKADVHGSAEALKAALSRIEHEEVKVRVLHSAVGGVTESDINLSATAKGVIVAFNVKPEAKGKRLADELGVQIRQYSVIYDAIDDVTSLLEGMLTPIVEEVVLGHAEVRNLFNVPKLGAIAGCNVTDGKLERGTRLRLWRGKELAWEGDFASLKRFKDDVKEVTQGYDCGVGLVGYAKVAVGDKLECYEIKKTPRKLTTGPSRPVRDSAA